jgi:cell division protein FtsA
MALLSNFVNKLTNRSRIIKENVLFSIDLGSTSAKWVTIELRGQRDYKCLDMRAIPWTQAMLHKKTLMKKPIQESLFRTFRELETRFRLSGEDRRAIVSLPLATYRTEKVTVSCRIEAGHVRQEHKIDLINRARESSKDMVVLHAIPNRYYVNQRVTKDPIGMEATDFSMDVMLVGCEESLYEEFRQIFKELNVHVVKYVAPSLAFVNYFLSRMNPRIMNPLVFDLGGESSYLYNIRDGLLGHFFSVPYGGEMISRDIAHVLRTDKVTSKRLKEDYVDPDRERGDKENMTLLNGVKVDLDTLNDVVYARYSELLKVIEKIPHFDQMRDVSTHLILLGQGHPVGAAKWVQRSWHIQVLEGDDAALANTPYIPALALVDYCINNSIVMPNLSHRRQTLKHRLFQVVEDLF